uniref:Uncharacterized protein n=1 Tax=Janibacter limosus TaxID=53458 RepID=A0AC61U520_9MICO|nr:hypothetical protein [Janibacter limosus]
MLDRDGGVVTTSPAAITYGLVRGSSLVQPELLRMVAQVARDGVIRETHLELSRPGISSVIYVAARIAPLRRRAPAPARRRPDPGAPRRGDPT